MHTLGYDNISQEEFIFLGGTNPYEYVNEVLHEGEDSENLKFLDTFFPVRESWFQKSLPNRIVEKGAGRKRMVGRLMLFAKRQEVETRIHDLILKLDSRHDASNPSVVVISSSCGGTGSSIFYDMLCKFAVPSVNLFPIVLGPSMLVAENNHVHQDLADKVKMNAMAFFEELNYYMQFPYAHFSFYSNKSLAFKLPYILFFDNKLSYSSTIAGRDIQAFEKYVAECISLMFTGEYRDENSQDIWANIENIMDDMLNQPKPVLCREKGELIEVSNFISASFTSNPSQDQYVLDIMETLFNPDTSLMDEILSGDDIVRIKKPQKGATDPFNALMLEIDPPASFYDRFVEGFVSGNPLNEMELKRSGKLLTSASIDKYLKGVSSIVGRAIENKVGSKNIEMDESEESDNKESSTNIWYDKLRKFVKRKFNSKEKSDSDESGDQEMDEEI